MAGISQRGAYELLKSGVFSDFTITCGDRDFKVHRSIICADSHFFKSVAHGNFKETEQAKVTLSDENESTVARVVHFMYLGDYHVSEECMPDLHTGYDSTRIGTALPVNLQNFSIRFAQEAKGSVQEPAKPECDLLIHAEVYQAADKLNLEKLKLLSSIKFLQSLRKTPVDPTIFEEALLKVYHGTSPEDIGLRLTLTSLCIRNVATITKRINVVAAIEKHELLSWRIGTAMLATAFSKKDIALKAFATLAIVNTCSCARTRSLQSSANQQTDPYSSFGHFDPYRLESWTGVLQIRCVGCSRITKVTPEEIT